MKLTAGVLIFLVSSTAWAKQPKLYRCQQADGTVVVQDRRCQITNLAEASVKSQPKPSLSSKRNNKQKPSPAVRNPQRLARIGQPKSHSNAKRSPYFTFGWERFIPANWQLQQVKTQRFDQLLISRNPFSGLSDFSEGIKLSVYPNTLKMHRQGAFARALDLYHQIRDNSSYTLLDSQFKTHPNYKVFNIKYLLPNKDLALTEFYIDETHNDLFVLTIQAQEAQWYAQWQLAENIINKL